MATCTDGSQRSRSSGDFGPGERTFDHGSGSVDPTVDRTERPGFREDGPGGIRSTSDGRTLESAASPALGGTVHLGTFGHTSTGVGLATSCGPVGCEIALLIAGLVGVAALAGLEYGAYRVAAGVFPNRPLERRRTLAYLTAVNVLVAPLIVVAVYSLFP